MAREGLRRKKTPGTLRLIYLGDSNTAAPFRGNYPQQVQQMLEASGLRAETINTAVPGYTSENARVLLESELSHFDADYLFIYLGWNDLFHFGPESLLMPRMVRANYRLNPFQRALTYVYSLRLLFAAQFLLSKYEATVDAPLDETEHALYDNYRPHHFYDNLRAILQFAKKLYPHVYLMTMSTITNDSPTPEEMRKAHFPKGMSKNLRKLGVLVAAYNQAIRTVAREENVPILDFFELFDSHEMRALMVDSCHFRPEGAIYAARLVADEIERQEHPAFAAAASR